MSDLDDLIALCDDSDSDSDDGIIPESPSASSIHVKQQTTTLSTSVSSLLSANDDDDDDKVFLNIDLESIERQAAERRRHNLALKQSPSLSTATPAPSQPPRRPTTATTAAAAPQPHQKRQQHRQQQQQSSSTSHVPTKPPPSPHHQDQTKTFRPKPAGPVLKTAGVLEEFSGMRVKDRTIGLLDMRMHMKRRTMVKIKNINTISRTTLEDTTRDWVTIGAVYDKSMTRTSKNGKKFQIWSIGDLQGSSLSMFLFGDAFHEHNTIPRASIVIFLNAKVLPSKGKSSIALSVTTTEQIIVLGTAGNFGVCRSLTRDGRRCKCVINTNNSKYCDYHINAQYKKINQGRMDIAGSKVGVKPGAGARRGGSSSGSSSSGRNGFGHGVSGINRSGHGGGLVGIPNHFSQGSYVIPGMDGHSVGIGARGSVATRPMNEMNSRSGSSSGGVGGSSQMSRRLSMTRFRGGGDSMKRLRNALQDQSKEQRRKKPGYKGMAAMLGVASHPSSSSSASAAAAAGAASSSSKTKKGERSTGKKRKKDLLGLTLSSSSSSSSSSHSGRKMSQKHKKQRTSSSGRPLATASTSTTTTTTSSISGPTSLDKVKERAQGVQQQFVIYRETVLEANNRKRTAAEARKRNANERKKQLLVETLRKNNIKLVAPNPNDHEGMEKAFSKNRAQFKNAGIHVSSSSSSSSSTFGVSDVKQKKILLQAKSINAKYGDIARDTDLDRKLSNLEEQDQMLTKMSKIIKLKISAHHCATCQKTYEYLPQSCRQSGHEITRIETYKRFWMCTNCHRRDSSLEKYMVAPCRNCGQSSWKSTGMKSQKIIGVKKMNVMNEGHGQEFNFGRGSKY